MGKPSMSEASRKKINVLRQRLSYFRKAGKISGKEFRDLSGRLRDIVAGPADPPGAEGELELVAKAESLLLGRGIAPARKPNFAPGQVIGGHTYTGKRNKAKRGCPVFRCNKCGREYADSNLTYDVLMRVPDCGCAEREEREKRIAKKKAEREINAKLKEYPNNFYKKLYKGGGDAPRPMMPDDPLSYIAESGMFADKTMEVLSRRFVSRETLDQVGEAIGLSRERPRQIETAALGKIRAAITEGRLWAS